MKVKYLPVKYKGHVSNLPSFHKSGSIKGMKEKFYGTDALLVKCGSYIYNVTSKPRIYHNLAH